MASAGATGGIQVWGTGKESAEELFVVFGPDFEYDDYVSRYDSEYPPSNVVWRQLFVLPCGELAARADDGLMYSWDMAALNSTSAIVTSDGVKIWDLSEVAEVDSGPPEGISQAGLLDGGQFVLYADFILKMPFGSGGAITAIAELGDGRIAVNSSHVDDPIYVWDMDEVGN